MKKNPITKNDGVKLISDFHTTLATHNTGRAQASTDFAVAGRKALYEMLADAYGKSLQLTADPVVLGQVCEHYKSKAPGQGENPHSAIVRIFWRKKDKGVLVPDKSAWKYGKGFRAAQALKWTAANYADNLAAYELTVTGKDGKEKKLKGHIALEAYDTQLNGNPEAQFDEQENSAAQAWLARTQAPLASMAASLVEDPKHHQMVGLVAQYDAHSGEWQVRAVNQSDHGRAWATIAKPTLDKFREWRTEAAIKIASTELEKRAPEDIEGLLLALNGHNREVEAREAATAVSRKLVVFDKEGDFAWPRDVSVDAGAVTSSDQDAQAA